MRDGLAMNCDETIAFFERCDAARTEAKAKALVEGKSEDDARGIGHETAQAIWNEWAEEMLARRKRLEETRRWAAERDSFGVVEARNEETRQWLEAAKADFATLRFAKRVLGNEVRLELGEIKSRPAVWKTGGSIVVEDEEINFSGFIFPGTADFEDAQFFVTARFGGAQFSGEVRFRDAQFSRESWFDRVQFFGEVQFQLTQFLGRTWFKGTQFLGSTNFEKAKFARETWFDEAHFADKVRFGAVQFSEETRFHKAEFLGSAGFHQAQFSSMAWFDKAQFVGEARFDEVQFSGSAWFDEAQFAGGAVFRGAQFFVADFQNARFSGEARFDQAQFLGDSDFRAAQFSGDASFSNAQFSSNADFGRARFSRNAWFIRSDFARSAVFTQAGFDGEAFFSNARFAETADFRLASFPGHATFAGARFEFCADFNAIRGARAFDLAGAAFDQVPDFIQAHFDEPPRLDNLSVRERVVLGAPMLGASRFWRVRWSYPLRSLFGVLHRIFRADRDIPARWRALKRLAIQATDHDRAQEFFAREIRSGRFAWDWPLPWPVWKASVWVGFFRFWLGICYGLFSDYGRSVARPLIWWLGAIAVSAMVYLGEHEGVRQRRDASERNGAHWAAAYLSTSYEAWRLGEPCYVPGDDRPGLGALSPAVRERTSAPKEALDLALRTGLVLIDPDTDNARRIYGCLYGVERFGETVAPIVPPPVSHFMILEKIFCALMIILFGLALRNMLRMW